jgi:hypothetical protein
VRIGILAAMVALVTLAASAQAQRFDLGPQLALPVAGAQVGHAELGIGGGLTFTAMHDDVQGFGVDVVYHYWPVSSEFKDDFDVLLGRLWQKIDADTWAFSALQTTIHVKVVAPMHGRFSPWVQAGAGVYRIDRNLNGATVLRVTYDPGGYGTLGFDVPVSARTKLGLDATYHHLWSETDLGSDFGAFEIGAHVLFGL